MTSALEFKSVSKTFRKRRKAIHAVKDISFSINEGEVFGFVGPNGAGKSTTIKILLDIINDYEGEVSIYGKSAHDACAREGIAYLPEAPALYEQLTPLEILQMALNAYGKKGKNARQLCDIWLERLSITQFADRRIRHLSKGNAQRVAIAHAMVVQPKLLILDEPLSGLDPVGRKDVVDLLLEYKQNGGAIFFTSHVLHDVERIADRFGFINNGELITSRTPQDLTPKESDIFTVRYRSGVTPEGNARVIRDGEYEVEIHQAALPEFMQELSRNGGRMISLNQSVSLETVFFRILAESNNNLATDPS